MKSETPRRPKISQLAAKELEELKGGILYKHYGFNTCDPVCEQRYINGNAGFPVFQKLVPVITPAQQPPIKLQTVWPAIQRHDPLDRWFVFAERLAFVMNDLLKPLEGAGNDGRE